MTRPWRARDGTVIRGSSRWLGGLAVGIVVALGHPGPARAAATDYASAPFDITTHSYAFGQAPVFMPDGRVVFGKDFRTGAGNQVYMANFDGSGLRCLTCSTTQSDNVNGVPAVRPQGD